MLGSERWKWVLALRSGGTRVDRGGVVMKRFLRTRTTVLVGASALALSALISAPARADVTAQAQLEGWHSPAAGTLDLGAKAASTDAQLTEATLTVDGAPAGSFPFCPDIPAGCSSGRAAVSFVTTNYADGVRHLVVTVHDSSGDSAVITSDVEVWNNRGPNCSPSCSAALSIGSDPTAEPPAVNPGTKNGGGVQGANESSCKSPRLSMSLGQKPLRVSHGVPVLLKNKSYRFTGRLTCLINGKRKSAAKGARIEVRNTVGRKTVRKASGKVGNGGKITVLLKYPSSRTIEFRFTSADHKTSKVRIKVRIAQRKS